MALKPAPATPPTLPTTATELASKLPKSTTGRLLVGCLGLLLLCSGCGASNGAQQGVGVQSSPVPAPTSTPRPSGPTATLDMMKPDSWPSPASTAEAQDMATARAYVGFIAMASVEASP